MYFNKNTVSKHKNASIKIINSFILRFVICILHSKWTHANCSTAKQIISIFYAVKPYRYAVQRLSSRASEPETPVRFPALHFIYIKCARDQMYFVTRYTNGSAPDGALPFGIYWLPMERSRAGAVRTRLCGIWILMSSEYSIANFNFYVAAYIFLSNYNFDTISLTLNNRGNCRKQKPQTVKRCFVR